MGGVARFDRVPTFEAPLMLQRCVLLIALPVLAVVGPTRAAAADTPVYVEVKAAKIRSEPRHWASGVESVSFGVPLTELAREASWVKVRAASGATGYLHESALTSRRIILKGEGGLRDDESADSVVLAGKGFNADVEAEYAASGGELNYAAVDTIEAAMVSEDELYRFLIEGRLNVAMLPGGGEK